MTDIYSDIYSFLDSLGFQEGSVDVLAIIRDSPRESQISTSLPMSSSDYTLLAVDNFAFRIEQSPNIDTRYAGEGAESNTFMIPGLSLRITFQMPIQIPAIGYVDPGFALLWDYCNLSYYGTAGVAKTHIVFDTSAIPAGQQVLTISNIADFIPLLEFGSPLAQIVDDDGIVEIITIVSVDKDSRQITLESPTELEHTIDSELIAYLPRDSGVVREPAFSLSSMREGFLSPCLVDKISLEINADSSVVATVEILVMNISRNLQMTMSEKTSNLLFSYASQNPISQILHGSLTSISPSSYTSGSFGLESVLGDNLFGGYQTTDLPLNSITGITLNIENNLQGVYALHSLKNDFRKRRRENSFPFALQCQGRKISGSIKYKMPIDPFLFAERLSGPSALSNGGLIINCDGFQITIPEMVWSPSTSDAKVDEFQNRTLNWFMVAQHFDSMPTLDYGSN